jgi:cytochrome P450
MLRKVAHGLYLHHPVRTVLNETLRLFTPLPMSIRDTRDAGVRLPPSDVTHGSPPMYMPPRTPIVPIFYLMHRSKALWGPDAEEFKPERWFDKEVQKKVAANPAIFAPFASGPRNVSADPRPILARNERLNEKCTVYWSELRHERGYAVFSPPAPTLR